MESIKPQIQDLYAQADEQGRQKIQNELRDLQTSFDTDWDVVVRLASGWLQMALAKVGIDLHIFELLVNSTDNAPLSLGQLAKETGADAGLLGHLVRAKAAFGLIKETDKDTFTANRMTICLSNPNIAAATSHLFTINGLTTYHLPTYLSTHSYAPITDPTDLPFHLAFPTPLTPFEWLKQNPTHLASLGAASAIQRSSSWVDVHSSWIINDVEPFIPESTTTTTDSALLVDIGGGYGQQALAFATKFPQFKTRGRIVVQDIPETLDRRPSSPSGPEIEFQSHDFFTLQPIRSAKYYYLRHILHDWSDDACIKILKAIVPAMGPQSRIVIDEVVLPDEGLSWQAACMDLTMMTSLGGIERTRGQFEGLLDGADLRVLDVKKYDAKLQSVILAVPK